MRYVIAGLISTALLIGAGPALSCDMLGPNMHMGNVVSIDLNNNTFVILDAQSQQPIRFTASSKSALDSLHVNDAVKVGYEQAGSGELHSLNLIRI